MGDPGPGGNGAREGGKKTNGGGGVEEKNASKEDQSYALSDLSVGGRLVLCFYVVNLT